MCGICGFTGGMSDACDARAVIKRMCAVMAHRGPDGEGIFITPGVALGHRRLSLLDFEGGAQPMLRDGGMYAIVFNGEIYNYQELRVELVASGWEFMTRSDTEVLLVGYLAWGEAILAKLRGMFAFAIWDGYRQQLFCARDPFGIRPFYYTQQAGRFIFASEIKAILEHPYYERQLNREALEQYLCYEFNPLNETFFKGVFQLPPGHCACVGADSSIQMRRYESLGFHADASLDIDQAAALIDRALRESVRYHNIADVEVGCFLSSGVDSSYLAANLAQENPAMKTFSVGFEEFGRKKGERDEVSWAADLAAMLAVANASKRITEDEYWGAVPLVQWHMDEPCGDPSAIALWFVDELASGQVKAVLSGEGADEFFGGYPIYQAPLHTSRLRWLPKGLLRAGSKLLRRLGVRGANYLERASEPVEAWYYTNANGVAFSAAERRRLLVDAASVPHPQQAVRSWYCQGRSWDSVARMQFVDMNCWMVGDILLKTDKMAMAHSIESRVPFLDRNVWEVASRLPLPLRVTKHETKVALRKAAARVLPHRWAQKEKLGFPVPLATWLRDDARVAEVRAWFTSAEAAKFFDVDELERLIAAHQRGEDCSRKIWIVLMFLVWYRIYFIDRAKPQFLRRG